MVSGSGFAAGSANAGLRVTRHSPGSDLGSRAMKATVIAALFVVVSAPALAAAPATVDAPILAAFTEAEGEGTGDEAPPTTAVSEGGIVPAELAPPAADEVATDQWTAKFLAPAVAILGILGVVAALALYGIRLRAKYRVVD